MCSTVLRTHNTTGECTAAADEEEGARAAAKVDAVEMLNATSDASSERCERDTATVNNSIASRSSEAANDGVSEAGTD